MDRTVYIKVRISVENEMDEDVTDDMDSRQWSDVIGDFETMVRGDLDVLDFDHVYLNHFCGECNREEEQTCRPFAHDIEVSERPFEEVRSSVIGAFSSSPP